MSLTVDEKTMTGQALNDYIKDAKDSDHWTTALDPLLKAGRDPAFQTKQITDYIARLDTAVGTMPKSHVKGETYTHPISDYVTSEQGAALVLDESVNRPGNVEKTFGKALDRFYADNPKVTKDPTSWTADERATYEPRIVSNYQAQQSNEHDRSPAARDAYHRQKQPAQRRSRLVRAGAALIRLGLIAVAASVALAPATAGPVRSGQPQYQISGRRGAVTAIAIAPVAGGRLVADHMIAGRVAVEHERASFEGAVGERPGSCGYAASVRPFTRLRRFGADGRVQWEWNLAREDMAIALLGPDDCLSPGGTRLLVSVYSLTLGDGIAIKDMLVAQGVIAVGRDAHGLVHAKSKAGAEAFGNPRTTGLVGWHAGRSATIDYEVDANTFEPRPAQADFAIPPSPPVYGDR